MKRMRIKLQSVVKNDSNCQKVSGRPTPHLSAWCIIILSFLCLFANTGQAQTTVKPGPVGIYCLEPFQDSINVDAGSVLAQDPVWQMKNVNGVAIRCSWEAVEPVEGQYNFALFDAALALARQYNKKVSFSITAGTFTPQWVYDAGAQPFPFTQNDGSSAVMPQPWDPIYQSKWFALIWQLGQYDSRPELAYVAMGGMGPQMETYFVQQAADIVTFDAMDGQTKWLLAGEAIEGQFAIAFPTTHLLFAVAPPTTDVQGAQTMDQLMTYCASFSPLQFGIRSDGLRPNYARKAAVGTLLTQEAGKITTGFQMSMPAVNKQSLTLWFTVAEQMKADFVEVFNGNCDDPTQAAAITKANLKL